jgi:dihydrofolate synthase/folylpolyglutamate synthase
LSVESYDQLIEALFPRLTGGIRWGLGRTRRMLASVGNPHRTFRSLHVGGTNGKGSVAATLESVLRAAGHRTGLYTSPHLCTFRERIGIAGRPIDEEALLAAARKLWPAVEALRPSFFEATTAMALLALAEAGVDVAVIEVGLGGRLDATNVITPEIAIVTNVALDHVQFLGPTLASVAAEKGGIFKRGVPALTAETAPESLAVLHAAAVRAGTTLDVLWPDAVSIMSNDMQGTRFRVRGTSWNDVEIHTPLLGAHQAVNSALAVAALDRLPVDLRPDREILLQGIAAVDWPGRLQVEHARDRTWVFDVAHNVAGVQALSSALAILPLPAPRILLVGVLGDKDWRNMLRPLYAVADGAVLTRPPTAPVERAWDPDTVLAEVPDPGAEATPDFTVAMDIAARRAGPGGTIIVTGSFHTVGDALAALGRAPAGVDPGMPAPPVAA